MTTTAPTVELTDDQAAALLHLALHTPAGVTAPTAAAAVGRGEAWVLEQVGAIPGVGPDLRTGHTRYQAAGPVVSLIHI